MFNLKAHLLKTAFYEDVRGYWNTQRRAWMNCYKCKSDDGKGPQDAWNTCLDEYQKSTVNSDWALEYGGNKDGGKKPYLDSKTPFAQKLASMDRPKYAEEIKAEVKGGKSTKSSIKEIIAKLENKDVEKDVN